MYYSGILTMSGESGGPDKKKLMPLYPSIRALKTVSQQWLPQQNCDRVSSIKSSCWINGCCILVANSITVVPPTGSS